MAISCQFESTRVILLKQRSLLRHRFFSSEIVGMKLYPRPSIREVLPDRRLVWFNGQRHFRHFGCGGVRGGSGDIAGHLEVRGSLSWKKWNFSCGKMMVMHGSTLDDYWKGLGMEIG